jgi:hypothetical protein
MNSENFDSNDESVKLTVAHPGTLDADGSGKILNKENPLKEAFNILDQIEPTKISSILETQKEIIQLKTVIKELLQAAEPYTKYGQADPLALEKIRGTYHKNKHYLKD